MSAPLVKPAEGTVAPVEVVSVWKHLTMIIGTVMAIASIILAALVQLNDIPGLPTNITAMIGSAITVLTVLVTLYQKLYGKPQITPTAAAKVIQSTSEGN
jgi:hypothetical protein